MTHAAGNKQSILTKAHLVGNNHGGGGGSGPVTASPWVDITNPASGLINGTHVIDVITLPDVAPFDNDIHATYFINLTRFDDDGTMRLQLTDSGPSFLLTGNPPIAEGRDPYSKLPNTISFNWAFAPGTMSLEMIIANEASPNGWQVTGIKYIELLDYVGAS